MMTTKSFTEASRSLLVTCVAVAAAILLWGQADVSSQAGVTWWTTGTLDTGQSSNTSGGKTTGMDYLHNHGDQNSSECEHFDFDDTSNKNADGTSASSSIDNHQSPDGSTWSRTRDDYRDANGNRTVNERTVQVDEDGNRTTTSTTDQYDSHGNRIGEPRRDVTRDKVEPPKPPKPPKEEPKKQNEEGRGGKPSPKTPPPEPPKRPTRPPGSSGTAPPPAGAGSQVVLSVHENCSSSWDHDQEEQSVHDLVTGSAEAHIVYRIVTYDSNTGLADLELVSQQVDTTPKGGGKYKDIGGMSASWTYQPKKTEALYGLQINFTSGWLQVSPGDCPCSLVNKPTGAFVTPVAGGFAHTYNGEDVLRRQLRYTFKPDSKSIFAQGHAGYSANPIPDLKVTRQVDYSVSVGGAAPGGQGTTAQSSGTLVPDGEIFPMVIDTPQGRIVGLPLNMGQKAKVCASGNTVGEVKVSLIGPDGSEMTSASSSALSFGLSSREAPATGTYSIVVKPGSGRTGQIGIRATSGDSCETGAPARKPEGQKLK